MTGQGLLFGLVIYVVWTMVTFPVVVRISRTLQDRPVWNRLVTSFSALGLALLFLTLTVSMGPSYGIYGAANLFVHQGLVTLIYLKRRRNQKKADKRRQKEKERYLPLFKPVENETMVGVWRLASSYNTMTEVEEYLQQQAEREIVMLNVDPGDLDKQVPVTGLTLRINADGSFSKQCFGRPVLEWYNDEGVSTDVPEPFSGHIIQDELGTFLHANGQSVNETGLYSQYLRYHDGDTIVSDRLSMIDTLLIRTVNVLVDEAYLYRCVYCYQRA